MAKGEIKLLLVKDYSMRNAEIEHKLSFSLQQLYSYVEVISFETVNEALTFLEYTEADIILSGFKPGDLSGVDFLTLVRNTQTLSHIPFILMGDWMSSEDELRALLLMENGIIKTPFNFQQIAAKIKGTVDFSKKIKNSKILENQSDLHTAATADSFFFKFTQLVHGFIDTPVDIDNICAEMKISRSTLQRKVKQLTGNTLSKQINIIKTQYAKKIIQSTNYPLKTIASMVGFNSISYFNSVYKKIEGETPSKSRITNTHR
ncbi:helix-turn-helix domain-containing protein [Oscillatoria amoena NRMC-F 0135]|nr:helix-turn-helix domain-containing protein [Oscillatoria amoena NRMC-F 0135]